MSVYLNTYETHEAYGGHEEGGWWFECGTPVQSVFIFDEDFETWIDAADPGYLHEMREGATVSYTQGKPPTPVKNGYGGYSFVVGTDTPTEYRQDNSFRSYFEEGFAQPYPEERPRYE